MKHRIEDLLDIPRLQSALDILYISTQIPSSIIDNEGKIHAFSGWRDVCTKFHRVHPEARKRCIESNLHISRHIHEGQPSFTYKCPHGLVDSATPIVVEGEHIGNVFTGQMFLEEPDLDYFRAQARGYGFDEEEYIDAVKKVPVVPEQSLRENLAFIAHLTGMLAEMGLKRSRETEAERRIREAEERSRAEEAQRESEEHHRAILRTAMEGFWMVDMQGRLLEVNETYCRMSGYGAQELLTMRISDLEAVETAEDVAARIRKIAAEGEARFESRHRRKDGTVYDVEVSVKNSPVGGGALVVFLRDITGRKRVEEERRKLEQQVQQTQRLESLGVLAGGIAHDFNNLLMAVLGHAELAIEEISPLSPARGNLDGITTAARRAADLCHQMLAYAGKAAFTLERMRVRELVEEMVPLLQTAISKMAVLTLNLERGLPSIQADPGQIRQVVMNLVVNASEAIGGRSGVITVSVGATRCGEEDPQKTELSENLPPGLYVHLEVADTGCGMDAQTRARIFEPFFSTKFAGRGLGLAAVLGIVRSHNGALKVQSEPGKGTTFKVLFPALERAGKGEGTDDSPAPAPWRGKGTILLVDDEESLLALGASMLERLGFSVLTAADGLQAVERYRERGKEIDLVLMDLTMPNMDGAKAFSELRRLNPDVRVVLASGYSKEDVAARFGGKGLSEVLQKPYTMVKLRELLAGLVPIGRVSGP